MCNLAGYIGAERAAPILIEMLKSQEGFAGGFYTGIATIHEGKLYWRKVIGALKELLTQTDALELPGSIGIIHSRSKGYGNVEWAHPFLNPSEDMAYVLNGHMGDFYKDEAHERAIMHDLLQNGYGFRTRVPEAVSNMSSFDDGSSVHRSEVMCLWVDHLRKVSSDCNEALLKASAEFPAEIVGLLLCADEPACIHAVRFNQPLMIGRKSNETFLSTTALAFPDELDSIIPAPIRSVMKFQKGSFEVYPIPDATGPVADIFPMAKGYKIIESILTDNKGHCIQEFKDATANLWPVDMAPQKDMMAYEILRLLHSQKKICFKKTMVEGVAEKLLAPLKLVYSVGAEIQ